MVDRLFCNICDELFELDPNVKVSVYKKRIEVPSIYENKVEQIVWACPFCQINFKDTYKIREV